MPRSKPSMRVRDPLYGFVEYSDVEEDVLNSLLVQRLRGISQLALAEMAYPGATHTRFEHSIGTMHVAGRLASQIRLSKRERALVRLAGLLHDVGHGPFSHVSEELLELEKRISRKKGQQLHSLIGIGLLRSDSDMRKLLGSRLEDVVLILSGSAGVLSSIISGMVDADRLDYLYRDSYYAGVRYGVYDMERIITAALREGDALLFHSDGVHAIEQFLLARHHMKLQVYAHRIRLITDAMIKRMVELAMDDSSDIRRAFTYEDSDEFLSAWREMDDNGLISCILRLGGESARAIALRLIERRLLKRAVRVELKPGSTDFREDKTREFLSFRLVPSCRRQIEQAIAEELGLQPFEVIVNVVRLSAAFSGPKMDIEPGEISVKRETGRQQPLSSVDQVIIKNVQTLMDYVEVYLPMDVPRRERRRLEMNWGLRAKKVLIREARNMARGGAPDGSARVHNGDSQRPAG